MMFRDGLIPFLVDALIFAFAAMLSAIAPALIFGLPFEDAFCTTAFGIAFSSPLYYRVLYRRLKEEREL